MKYITHNAIKGTSNWIHNLVSLLSFHIVPLNGFQTWTMGKFESGAHIKIEVNRRVLISHHMTNVVKLITNGMHFVSSSTIVATSISSGIPVQSFLRYRRKTRLKIRTRVMGLEGHPPYKMLPEVKNTRYRFGRKSAVKPKVNTKRFMNSFVNRLTFKYDLAPQFL